MNDLTKKEQEKLEEIAKEFDLGLTILEIEYGIAKNNGHPNPDEAIEYAKNKTIENKEKQYKILKENNINCKF